MPGIDFNALRNEITMQQVLDQLRFEPIRRRGDQLRGPCPVHGSTSVGSRSFSVNLSMGRYYCHKCKSHGNALELWAEVHGMTVYQAGIDLCRALGRTVPSIHRKEIEVVRNREKRHRYSAASGQSARVRTRTATVG